MGNSSLDVLMEIHRQKDIKKDVNNDNKNVNESETEMDNENESGAILIKENVSSRLLSSLFTYVARDKQSGKACPINRFIPNGVDEENLFKRREYLAKSRKNAVKKSVLDSSNRENNSDTTVTDAAINSHHVILSLVERGSAMEDMPALASNNSVLMRYTALENVLVCQPQNVNTAGRVFGGYLSKKISHVFTRSSFLLFMFFHILYIILFHFIHLSYFFDFSI